MLYRETTRALLLMGLGPVHATLENFENGVFTLKMHQTFSVHTTSRKFENAAQSFSTIIKPFMHTNPSQTEHYENAHLTARI